MEAYITSVLKHTFLPTTVREEVSLLLRREFEEARAQGQSDEEVIAGLGSPYELAEGYNLNYRGGVRARLRKYNIYIGLLAAVIVGLSFFCLRHLFVYAQERVEWYVHQSMAQLTAQGSPNRLQEEDDGRMAPPEIVSGEKQGQQPLVFRTSIDFSTIIICGVGILICSILVNYFSFEKKEWRSWKMHLPASREAPE